MTRNEAAAYLLSQDHYLILTHRRPDGDTLGCAAALCRGLRQLGKTAWILENPEVTPLYAPLLRGLTKPAPEEADRVICVDVASPGMLPQAAQPLAARLTLRIDHHASPAPFAPRELVDPEAGACGEILYDLFQMMGVTLDKPISEALYTAVATDTGGFRYANTSAHSFLVAAACAQGGGDLFRVNQAVFETSTLAKLRIRGWAAENTRLTKGGQVAVCPIPKAVETQFGVTEDDMESISGLPRSIQGVRAAAVLRELPQGQVRLSLRTVPGVDAAAICRAFGGGGHPGAAGATLTMPLEEAAQAVARAMEAAV